MNFVTDSHCTQRMDPGDTDPLMFAVAHPACRILYFSRKSPLMYWQIILETLMETRQ